MQKISKHLLFLLLLFMAIGRLSAQSTLDKEIEVIVNQLITQMSSNQTIKNVAVVDFTNLDGTPTALGRYLAEEFSYSLVVAKKKFNIIDRSKMSMLLKEAGLDAKGLFDPSSAPKLGKLQGIDVLITGSTTELDKSIRLNVKLLQLETSSVIGAARGDITQTPTIKDLLEKQTNDENTDKTPDIKVKVESIFFELTECVQRGLNIECSFKVLSEGLDVNRLSIFTVTNGGKSRLFDDEGNEYYASVASIGNSQTAGVNRRVDKSLVANIPVNAKVTYNGINKKLKLIPKLEIHIWIGYNSYTIEMRNIKVKQ